MQTSIRETRKPGSKRKSGLKSVTGTPIKPYGRTQVSLENIRQFILDLNERDHVEFLYPSDPDSTEEVKARNVEAKRMLETLRDIEGTLRGLD
jgi:hypothetical protein